MMLHSMLRFRAALCAQLSESISNSRKRLKHGLSHREDVGLLRNPQMCLMFTLREQADVNFPGNRSGEEVGWEGERRDREGGREGREKR